MNSWTCHEDKFEILRILFVFGTRWTENEANDDGSSPGLGQVSSLPWQGETAGDQWGQKAEPCEKQKQEEPTFGSVGQLGCEQYPCRWLILQ